MATVPIFVDTEVLLASVDERDSHQEGWGECLERLQEYLSDV